MIDPNAALTKCKRRTYLITEYLVYVRVEDNTFILRRWHKILPVTQRLKGIMDHHDDVTLPTIGVRVSDIILSIKAEKASEAKNRTECFGNCLSNTAW